MEGSRFAGGINAFAYLGFSDGSILYRTLLPDYSTSFSRVELSCDYVILEKYDSSLSK